MMSLASMPWKIASRIRPGQDPPAVGLRPGDVDEVVEEDVGPLLADHPGGGVEVVVVEHHQRPLVALDLPQDRLGDVAVDRLVAEVPGVELLAGGCPARWRGPRGSAG